MDDEGTLTISGKGNMTSWFRDNTPWYTHRNIITNVVIDNGVTRIGNYAFYNCSNLANIAIPNGVTSIGDSTYYNCSSLRGRVMPEVVIRVGAGAF